MAIARDDKRNDLLEAGIDLVSERPFSRITMDDIARRSGVTKPMVYYYFGSKEGFYRELARYVISVTRKFLSEGLRIDCSLRESLEHFVRMRLDFARRNPRFTRAIHTLFTDENVGEYIADIVEEFQKFMEIWDPLFDKAIDNGEIKPDTNRILVLDMIHATITHIILHMTMGSKLPSDHLPAPEELIDLLYRGIQSDGRSVE
jgi:AcrR family transcriptional regulator